MDFSHCFTDNITSVMNNKLIIVQIYVMLLSHENGVVTIRYASNEHTTMIAAPYQRKRF